MSKAVGYKNSDTKSHYIFNKALKSLYNVDSVACYCHVRNVYKVLDREIKEIIGAIKTYIHVNGTEFEPHLFAHYVESCGHLYISDLDNQIYKLTGNKIECVENGTDGIIFELRSNFTPIHLETDRLNTTKYFESGFDWDLFKTGQIFKHIIGLANFAVEEKHDLSAEEQQYLLAVYIYSLFFESILQDKPILCFEGVKASGKSFIATLIGKMLFGNSFLPSPLSDNRRDFQVALAKNYYVVFDNLD